jgi:hypothetical protein
MPNCSRLVWSFPVEFLAEFFISHMHTSCCAHLIFLHLITLTILGEHHKLCFSHPIVISCLVRSNILLRNLFSETLNLFSSLRVRNQISHPYKTTDWILFILGVSAIRLGGGGGGVFELNCSQYFRNLNLLLIVIITNINSMCGSQFFCCNFCAVFWCRDMRRHLVHTDIPYFILSNLQTRWGCTVWRISSALFSLHLLWQQCLPSLVSFVKWIISGLDLLGLWTAGMSVITFVNLDSTGADC